MSEGLGLLTVTIGGDLRIFKEKMRELARSAKDTAAKAKASFKKIGDVGKDLTTKLTLPIALLGGGILKIAGDYEAGMNTVKALTGAVGDEFEALKNQAKELGKTTQFSASEASEAMGFMAQGT